MDIEQEFDLLLNIKTTGRDDSDSNFINFPYEPTPYAVLERLANSGYITKKNTVLDYGCGKGRVDFYLTYQLSCHTIGIEYNERIYSRAVDNLKTAKKPNKIAFFLENAEDFIVPKEVDCVYFFNPFCVSVLKSAMRRVKDSYHKNPRAIRFFFYYPSEQYIEYLKQDVELQYIDSIDCSNLFESDTREEIQIYELKTV